MGLPKPSSETKFSGTNERRQGNINFPCSADHEQDWQPYPVDHNPLAITCVTILTYMYVCMVTHIARGVWINRVRLPG